MAARTVFERDGYLDARLVDITVEAGIAAGSFYTYFTSKQDIFAAVLEELQDEMLHQHVRQMADGDDPIAIIEASNRGYLKAYLRNAKLMRLLEQVAAIDDNVRELRSSRGRAFVERNERSIRELQSRGIADPDLDPLLAATALSAMVGRIAYMTFVAGEKWSLEELVDTLTRLWVNALRIPSDGPSRAAKSSRARTSRSPRTSVRDRGGRL